MKLLITGVCGFAGSTLALSLREAQPGVENVGIDNFIRPGSEQNRQWLQSAGIKVLHADLRVAEDLETLPKTEWVIDAAANSSMLAGVSGSGMSSRQLMQHNFEGTIHILEFCRARQAGFILLSTSRGYSIPPLAELKVDLPGRVPSHCQLWPRGLSGAGVAEDFATSPPVSLYGVGKVCSEALAIEYGQAFGLPVWINRLGVLAGARQFGRADQGIFSFWIHSCVQKRPLKFIGFGGEGFQVRDCPHPRDLIEPCYAKCRQPPILTKLSPISPAESAIACPCGNCINGAEIASARMRW